MGYIVSGGRAVRVQSNTFAHLREAITDVSRTIEDLTWTNLSQDTRTIGLDDEWTKRKDLLARFRIYRRRSPLAKQAFNLLKNYVLGQGVTIRPNNKSQVARIVDEFWDDPVNAATFTSHDSMVQALDTLYTDGDLFLILYPDRELGRVQLGWIDSWLVQDVITDSMNWRLPMWYKVRLNKGQYNFKIGTYEAQTDSTFVYYRDYRNDPDSPDYLEHDDPNQPKDGDIRPGYVFHIAINKRGKFGESELAAAADWLKAHKDFMEDRATLSRAAASLAWRKKRKGNAADVANQVAALRSSLVENLSRWETNPPTSSGGTIVENDGSSMDWIKTDTGAGNAKVDENLIRMMVGSSVGVMNHYFGDAGDASMNSATAMELPMLKMYEGWQKLIGDTIKTLLHYVLQIALDAGRIGPDDVAKRYEEPTVSDQLKAIDSPTLMGLSESMEGRLARLLNQQWSTVYEATPLGLVTTHEPKAVSDVTYDNEGAVDWYIDVDFPPIVQREIAAYIAALKNLFSMMPIMNIESQKLVVSMALTALGVNDIDEVMSRLFTGDFSSAAFAVIPLQSTGPLPPNALGAGAGAGLLGASGGQAGMAGAQPGIPKIPGTTDLPVGQMQPPSDRPKDQRP